MPVTIKDVARLARTSPSAVSFVVNGKADGLVSAPVQRRILKAIRGSGYRRHHAAAGLRLNRTFKVTLCAPSRLRREPPLGNMSHHELVNRLAHRLHEAGYGVVLFEVGRLDSSTIDRLSNEPMDGYAAVQLPRVALRRLREALHGTQRPFVAVDSPMEGGFDQPWQFGIDRRRSFELAVQYLIGRGLRQIAMLGIDIPGEMTLVKRHGYERAMRAARLEPLPLYEMTSPGVRGLREAIDQLFSAHPAVEGVILTDNYLAPVAQQMIGGRRVTLVGFGDEGPAKLCDPKLAYLRLPVAELADLASRSLIERIEERAEATVGQGLLCELVEAESEAPA